MNIIGRLRAWWQWHTGEEDTPFDGDAPAWVVSLLVHLLILVAVAIFGYLVVDRPEPITVEMAEPIEQLEVPAEFYFSNLPSQRIGANSQASTEAALALAPVLDDYSQVPTPEVEETEIAEYELQQEFIAATAPSFSETVVTKGAVGVGTTGAEGAIDRITHEILLSLQERKTLVVWLFDQSGSLAYQREQILARFDRIYEELGVIEAAGNPAFSQHADKPLLTSVVAFGGAVQMMTERPTDSLAEIRAAVQGITEDITGTERTFQAIYSTADFYRSFRRIDPETSEPIRNVMIVVFTDEVGDDYPDPDVGLEPCVDICRRYEMPVYVVGVPAPFGRQETYVKWIDRDFAAQYPNEEQRPQWGVVNQGPETLMPERLKLYFASEREDEVPLDSGFGPFALTRLCWETGGIYFSVHPNRDATGTVGGWEVDPFSAHFSHFFDPDVMRLYRPDYVSIQEYQRRLGENRCRRALVEAASLTWITPMSEPRLRFVKRDEASFATELTEAQKEAAKLEPQVNAVYGILQLGEEDRQRERVLRWQAGYDLAMGRLLAVKVRTETYNLMLAAAKRGELPMVNEQTNSWVLRPSNVISVGSQHERLAQRSRMYLERVIAEHPNTPWALLAQRELEIPLSWEWSGYYTDLNPPRENMGGGGNAPPPRDDQPRSIPRPQPRPVGRL